MRSENQFLPIQKLNDFFHKKSCASILLSYEYKIRVLVLTTLVSFIVSQTAFSQSDSIYIYQKNGRKLRIAIQNIDSMVFSSYSPSIVDVEGNVYRTVTIGKQQWMQENLKTTKYNDGKSIENITNRTEWRAAKTGAYCYYDNATTHATNYGCLYNWYVVKTNKVCPTGWHVPSDEEWNVLVEYLGGVSVAGGKMKQTMLWSLPNTGATNSSGFSAVPGGYRSYTGNFLFLGMMSYFWSSTNLFDDAWFRYLNNNYAVADRDYLNVNTGFSIRCIKN